MQWLLLKKVRNGDQASNYAKLDQKLLQKYLLMDMFCLMSNIVHNCTFAYQDPLLWIDNFKVA